MSHKAFVSFRGVHCVTLRVTTIKDYAMDGGHQKSPNCGYMGALLKGGTSGWRGRGLIEGRRLFNFSLIVDLRSARFTNR